MARKTEEVELSLSEPGLPEIKCAQLDGRYRAAAALAKASGGRLVVETERSEDAG